MARVLLFGRLGDVAGWRDQVIEAETLTRLLGRLTDSDPSLGEALTAPGVQVALDQVLVRGDRPLSASSEVAYLPPMSGG
mgnify:CR=1 FL=1